MLITTNEELVECLAEKFVHEDLNSLKEIGMVLYNIDNNPNIIKYVRAEEITWEEMSVGYIIDKMRIWAEYYPGIII
jgi:hypothetical protein